MTDKEGGRRRAAIATTVIVLSTVAILATIAWLLTERLIQSWIG